MTKNTPWHLKMTKIPSNPLKLPEDPLNLKND